MRRKLRQDVTPAEKLFWSKVARRQFYDLKFRKQHGIGKYIVDFYCPEKKLVIEIDGDSHFSKRDILKDQERDEFIISFGYRVVRYLNSEVLNNIDGIFYHAHN